MKITVLDGYTLNPGDLSWDGLAELGDLTIFDRTTFASDDVQIILDRIGCSEVIFTNKTPITREVIENSLNLKYIGVLATGYNVVDVTAAKEKGITVTNIPSYGTEAVAQMTFALLLEMCHHVAHHSEEVLTGRWSSSQDFCFWDFPLIELANKNIGIIGFGRIGQAVAKIAQAFGMKVLAFDTYKNLSLESSELRYADIGEILEKSDVLSLHCPLTEETKGIINKHTISKMKNGAMLINTSRGPLIIEEDLTEALNCGKLSAAAVDVVSSEPIKSDNPLLKAKNIIITPHIAWAPKESRNRLMEIAIDNLRGYLSNKPKNVVS